jgi:hypothetical protein
MPADTLVFKRKNGKSEIKIVPSMMNGQGHENCYIMVNMQSYKDFAQFLSDLKGMWNVPVDKAIEEYKKISGSSNWPF